MRCRTNKIRIKMHKCRECAVMWYICVTSCKSKDLGIICKLDLELHVNGKLDDDCSYTKPCGHCPPGIKFVTVYCGLEWASNFHFANYAGISKMGKMYLYIRNYVMRL